MTWLMTIAAGAALGYFLVQFITKNNRNNNDAGAETEAESFRAEAPESRNTPEAVRKERLHKSRRDRRIAGVCGGIAEYLHTDPTIIRLVAVVLVLGWGSGLLAYLICALVMPEE